MTELINGFDEPSELNTEPEMFTIISADGHRFTVPLSVACGSNVIKSAIDVSSASELKVNVDHGILSAFIEYLTYHDGNPAQPITKPLKCVKRECNLSDNNVCEWDVQFIHRFEQRTAGREAAAAYYLEIPSLFELFSAYIASYFPYKTPEEVREYYNLEDDLTDEEKDEIRRINVWCQDK